MEVNLLTHILVVEMIEYQIEIEGWGCLREETIISLKLEVLLCLNQMMQEEVTTSQIMLDRQISL